MVTAVSIDSSRRITRSQAAMRPTIPRHLTQTSVDSSTSHESSIFSEQPPLSESSQTDGSTLTDTPEHSSPCTGSNTPNKPLGIITGSSPLSSPPPGLFDPYENAASSTEGSSQDDFDCLDMSESEDTQQSLDFFSSQASNSNLRNMKGRDLFDSNIWADPLKTSVFYRFATSLRQRVKEVEPTVTHRFIAQMRDVGKLARVYTQNIDEIEKKIGLSTDLKHGFGNKKKRSMKAQIPAQPETGDGTEQPDTNSNSEVADTPQTERKSDEKSRSNAVPDRGVECVFLHGSLHALRCFVCGKLCDWDEGGRESRTLSGEQPECPHCAGATAARQEKGKRALGIGKLRPDIVLYGEEHPQSDLISPIVQHDLAAGPDLLLVLGTSLRVHGLKVMVKEFAKAVHKKGGKVVFINFTKPSESAWGDVLDYWIEWDCDAWVEDLKTRKPRLWLSPNERLELDRQRRESIAEKKREALKKRESINEKKRESIGDKARPPPKNPVAMRNDYQCGAYVVWDIFQTLAKIGGRPFDNLGHTPSSHAQEPVINAIISTCHGSRDSPLTAPEAVKKRRKPLSKRATSHVQRTPGKDNSSGSQSPAKQNLNPNGLSSVGNLDVPLTDPEATSRNTAPTKTNSQQKTKRPPRAKKPRQSAPAALSSDVGIDGKEKRASGKKAGRGQTGKDRYLQAVRDLVRSRKTPTSGLPANTAAAQLPTTPKHVPLASELHRPYLGPSSCGGSSEGQSSAENDGKMQAASYLFQLRRILPPLPNHLSIHHSAPARHSLPAMADIPVLAPLKDWTPSSSKIAPMEIAPFVGPTSPLTDKEGKGQYTYTVHHSTQPIYSDPLPGVSRQGIMHKPQRQVETNDDNTPSPSDQLHREAANQLWQMRGGTGTGTGT
jgi:NAD-dependent SIR2 family protein deacetylase